MKSARLLLAASVLLSMSCLSAASPPAAAPGGGAPAGGGGPPNAAGGADCAGQKIRSKANLSSCKDACRDQQRDQQRGCSDPACLQGVGAATNACFAQCDEGKKSSLSA